VSETLHSGFGGNGGGCNCLIVLLRESCLFFRFWLPARTSFIDQSVGFSFVVTEPSLGIVSIPAIGPIAGILLKLLRGLFQASTTEE